MKKTITIVMALLCIVAIIAFCLPAKVVQGKVVSFSESFPLEGVTVQVKGTKNITGTQPDGIFALEVQPVDSILVFSLPGYQTEEVKLIPGKPDYDIVLKAL
ncbi:carboxypeptidase-like regulatory domain-containing protein [Flavihumibacter fluvii]|uniref:carboxypeptidase-like regulatory domain-containing protein n=1 Tax=Flavihumibacter fluvii TaxID=2838157 RepID=UPI001BDEEAF8|nr:carboxypeptidase-like regulatory domain-containing protein [Flavihumibacter fluvii]ULQ52038.1 carboxypeptidase-like regulatory domain-containing protein [Flavihumibacter fluvii]